MSERLHRENEGNLSEKRSRLFVKALMLGIPNEKLQRVIQERSTDDEAIIREFEVLIRAEKLRQFYAKNPLMMRVEMSKEERREAKSALWRRRWLERHRPEVLAKIDAEFASPYNTL